MQAAEVKTSTPFPHLLSRFAIRGVQMRNRLVFQPHFTALGSRDGMPSDDLRAYHEERARGGVGLIIMESQAVHPTGKMSRRFMNAWDPAVIPGLARISRAVHSHGAMIFGQLTHGGHTSLENPPQVMWAPTQMPEPSSHHSTKAMDADDIRSVIDGSYQEAAVRERGVTIRLGEAATPEAIRALDPDVVVVATGCEPNLPRVDDADTMLSRQLGRHVLPEIDGLDGDTVVSSGQVPSGQVRLSGPVVVIDNNCHGEAAGTAEFLSDSGCRVTVIAPPMMVGENIEAGARTLFCRRAAIKGIAIRTATQVTAIAMKKVRVSAVFSGADAVGWAKYIPMPGEEEVIAEVDSVVPIIGRRSREDLYLRLKASTGIRVERVGDCAVPRLIQSTITEAFELAREL